MIRTIFHQSMLVLALSLTVCIAAAPDGAMARQDSAAVAIDQGETETSIAAPASQPLLQTTTLPWAFGDDYVAITALPVAGSGDVGSAGIVWLPHLLMLIGAVASAGGAIAIRTRHAG